MWNPRALQGVSRAVIDFVSLATLLCPATLAQGSRPSAALIPTDPFIAAVEVIKRSLTSVDCMAIQGGEGTILQRMGSAFFISETGDFVTAAHVILNTEQRTPFCPKSVITIPVGDWRPETRIEPAKWFSFNTASCRMDRDSDLAVCRLTQDPAGSKVQSRIAAVRFEWNIPPDGASVAFTGFPMKARDPMTFRTAVAAYRIPWENENPIPELALDRAALPGHSGSPVYLSDGRVIGIVIGIGKGEATGLTIARPASLLRGLVAEKPK